MLNSILDLPPRRLLRAGFLACLAFLAFGLYLQHMVGLNPCPMCIVQRYALLLVGLICLATSFAPGKRGQMLGVALALLMALAGAFVAARQSWLQWYPPEVSSCGRDLYGMIETFPLQRAIPMIFKGSGDCTAIDWTFLGGSLANWSFVVFSGITLVCLSWLLRRARRD